MLPPYQDPWIRIGNAGFNMRYVTNVFFDQGAGEAIIGISGVQKVAVLCGKDAEDFRKAWNMFIDNCASSCTMDDDRGPILQTIH